MEDMASGSETRKRRRGAGPRLNDLQRLEIIRIHQTSSPPVSMRQLARDFGVDEKSIRRIISSSADIATRVSSSAVLNLRDCVHRRPSPRFPELEKTLIAWIDARERVKAEISPSIVIDKAKLVARAMGITPERFKASWGWYDKFSRRYGISTAFVNSAGVKKKEEEEEEEENIKLKSLQDLHDLMTQYDPEWVFTVEETTLFYDALPFDAEVSGDRRRVTLLVSCNSTGRLKLSICMVGKDKCQGEQQRNLFPVPYLVQERAWLDRPTFGNWYSSVFVPFVRERTSKPVLLVVDGERPGYQGDFEDDGIRLVCLPPSPTVDAGVATMMNPKTSWSRPLGAGVIPALKARYKFLLVQSVLSYHNAPQEVKVALKVAEGNNCGGGLHFGRTPTLLDAARLLEQSWSQVPEDLLKNCFARANLVTPSKLLASPDILTSVRVLQEQVQATIRFYDDIVAKIEEMLVSSSLPPYAWSMCMQRPPAHLREHIRAFLHLDDENSFEIQRQLHGEISEVLSGVAPSPTTPGSAEPAPSVDDPEKSGFESQIRGLLLSITDVASRLRLLPQAGVDAARLAPLQLEGCIAAADQIRHCIQTFDNAIHNESTQEKQTPSKKNAAETMLTTSQSRSGDMALV